MKSVAIVLCTIGAAAGLSIQAPTPAPEVVVGWRQMADTGCCAPAANILYSVEVSTVNQCKATCASENSCGAFNQRASPNNQGGWNLGVCELLIDTPEVTGVTPDPNCRCFKKRFLSTSAPNAQPTEAPVASPPPPPQWGGRWRFLGDGCCTASGAPIGSLEIAEGQDTVNLCRTACSNDPDCGGFNMRSQRNNNGGWMRGTCDKLGWYPQADGTDTNTDSCRCYKKRL
eukprot:m.46795 g.46795  ORF g.46795 m.46795 type:complete len:229 (-) comp8800_c0_seq2:109-795(-)